MGAHHHHHHSTTQERGSGEILVAFALNFFFAFVELVGGLYTNSIAVLSDAIHDFGDSMALLMSFYFEKIGQKKADRTYTFGYRRFSVLAAFLNGAILFFGSIFVLKEAFERLLAPEPVQPLGVLGLAILGITVNGVAAFRLSKSEGLNQRMVMLHLLEDLMGWGATLIVSIVLIFKPWYILDSILSIIITFIILRSVYHNLRQVSGIFLQRFPDEIEVEDLVEEIQKLPEVKDVHCLQGWSIDESHHALNFHVVVPPELKMAEADKLKLQIKELMDKHHVKFSSIEFEADEESCSLAPETTP